MVAAAQWVGGNSGEVKLEGDVGNQLQPIVEQLLPPVEPAYLFENVQVLDKISCHLVTANLPPTKVPWAGLSDQPPSLQTFALYGKRFGGIEPHFKDYKSRAFDVLHSGSRTAHTLTC